MGEATASKRFAEEEDCSNGAVSPVTVQEKAPEKRGGDGERSGHSAITWLSLVCLDAPLVAVSWLWLFARGFHFPIARGGDWALFLTAWLIYLIDRFGDGLSIRSGAPTSSRQRFAVRHRSVWIAVMLLIAAADFVVIAVIIESQVSLIGAAIGALTLAYLIINRVWPRLWRILPVKEMGIGFLFAAGTMVPLSHALTSAVWAAWFIFACLCSLNCVSIAVWERELDVAQERISIATAFPHGAEPLVAALALIGLTSLGFAFQQTQERSLYLCLTFSALFLGAVHLLRNTIDSDLRTALADLVLLTPLFAIALT